MDVLDYLVMHNVVIVFVRFFFCLMTVLTGEQFDRLQPSYWSA